MADPIALLSDHVYLERKAATNALDLFNHWPESGEGPDGWANHLAAVVRDEAQHLESVLVMLKKRGGVLQRSHKSLYASELRKLVRKESDWRKSLIDRLLITAVIEARSCERFEILAHHCGDPELEEFYTTLEACESGHYRIFYQLALRVAERDIIKKRWEELLQEESRIIQNQIPGSQIHSGLQN